MKLYLAGPMTGLPLFNFPEFDRVAKELRSRGYEIHTPHEINYGETLESRGSLRYTDYLRGGLKLLLECEGLVLLPSWMNSKGAQLELHVADKLEMPVWQYWGSGRELIEFLPEEYRLSMIGL